MQSKISQPQTSTHLTEAEEARYAELQRQALDFARQGETLLLRLMVEAGLPVNLCDHKGQSLLMLASYNGNYETSQMLLQLGADPNRRNDRGQTPLGGVAFKGHLKLAELLVANGADIHADNGGGMTAIALATLFGRDTITAYLKNCGAQLRFRDRLLGLGSSLFRRLKR